MIQMVPNGTQRDDARKIPGLACYELHEVCCTDMIHISLRDSDRGVKNILQLQLKLEEMFESKAVALVFLLQLVGQGVNNEEKHQHIVEINCRYQT